MVQKSQRCEDVNSSQRAINSMKFQSKLQRVRESDNYGKCDIMLTVQEETNETNQSKK